MKRIPRARSVTTLMLTVALAAGAASPLVAQQVTAPAPLSGPRVRVDQRPIEAPAYGHGAAAAARRADLVPVFLIEDNRLLRDGLTAMLGAQGLTVIATARSGGEALKQVAVRKPQVVLLDSALGDRDSLKLVEEVKQVSATSRSSSCTCCPRTRTSWRSCGRGCPGSS